ncbi:hypothetical protein GUJ93_ZPchr0002g24314 [Zizania palustris]|uniref:Uncharacterized protein n=1 Tax=Zizania palustris TaxID=103762 RepID=A0A8J5RY32_ZIZPA|nr:hypothetical protein GUJ93_ZPchr0002g24314 [Zizania palustris]
MPDHRPKQSSDSISSLVAKRARNPFVPAFPTYKDAPDLSPKIRFMCEILVSLALDVDAALDDADVRVTSSDVEEVLRFSYAQPLAAVAFFRWVGIKLWSCMVVNGLAPLEERGNLLVSKLKEERLPEACKYAEAMID